MYFKNLFVLIFFLATSGVYSQDYLQEEPSRELELAAAETAEMWQKELAMTTKQTALMKKNIIEFALHREELLQINLPEEEKTRRLVALEILEDKDLRDILTKPQFEKYLFLKEQKLKNAAKIDE